MVEIRLGGKSIAPPDEHATGTLYIKNQFNGDLINKDFADIQVNNPNKGVSWGAVYWTYSESLDKIQNFKETPLTIDKDIYIKHFTDEGEKLSKVQEPIQVGNRIVVRLRLKVDRDMEFIHIKDQRGAGLEPVQSISGYKWQGGLGYYESPRDLANHYFIDFLPKGSYVFEYELKVEQKGEFSNGICRVQSMYAPEFSSHSSGTHLSIK
jgi:uncharacterized protein YfaS (alpha-2-macroglobulin family)